ncbi:MAG: methyltransferase domain-containing protein [Acidobacteria bacterium]|nr:methyltransferase domain-containing protein [Acidobacteriota bacterium]
MVEAFANVEREAFVGPGPWQIAAEGGYMDSGTDDPAILYQDINIGLVPKLGINNGQPSLHARCLAACAPKAGEVVVHVGAGTGYYTAMLARLVERSGHVHAFEINPDLASRSERNLSGYGNVTVHAASAVEAHLPPASVIYVCAGATHIPDIWLDALTIGGRLILPLTTSDGPGFMLLVTRQSGATYEARHISSAYFIGCIGARDETQSHALRAALRAQSPKAIRSLRRGEAPDETAWCAGPGWWLSTASLP